MEQTNTESQATPKDSAPVNSTEQTPQAPKADASKEVTQVPEKYELKLAENAPIDKSYLESFHAYAKEQKMTQDQAQKLIEREAFAITEFNRKQVAEFEKQQSEWVSAVKKDPEIGGESFNKNIEMAHRALKQYATPEFVKELEASGYGNHPELVRIFTRIGKAMSEDKIVSGNTNTGGKKSFAEIFYGKE